MAGLATAVALEASGRSVLILERVTRRHQLQPKMSSTNGVDPASDSSITPTSSSHARATRSISATASHTRGTTPSFPRSKGPHDRARVAPRPADVAARKAAPAARDLLDAAVFQNAAATPPLIATSSLKSVKS